VIPEDVSFRSRFCAYYRCAESEFERRALGKFLYPPWAAVLPLLLRVAPAVLATDLQIVRQLGLVTSGSNFAAEVRDIRGDYQRKKDFGILRRWLRLRLSRERLFDASRVWQRSMDEGAPARQVEQAA
jgi:hypothetical protein